jgi:N6-L-threonylcarbamoyladenine synthase
MTLVLAFETSCDDTAVSLVRDGREVLSSKRIDQNTLHEKYGGIIPEEAARQHLIAINPCLQEVLDEANCTFDDVDQVAATLGPGLVGSLLVGVQVAKTLAFVMDKPFVAVNHLQAHICSNFLGNDLEPPFLCLLVSGGHTQIMHVKNYTDVEIIGETLDDAVGEAYDKVARVMGLGFPGGPVVDKLAALGDSNRFTLPISITKNPTDFSFSGLKTATLRLFEKEEPLCETEQARDLLIRDVCAAFQKAAVTALGKKMILAAQAMDITQLAVCGGVSANRGLRTYFEKRNAQFNTFFPSMAYCTDNAAMVGSAAYFCPLSNDDRLEVFSRQFNPVV